MTEDKADISKIKEQVRDFIDSDDLSDSTKRRIAAMLLIYTDTNREFEKLCKNQRELAARVADWLVTEHGINYPFDAKLIDCLESGEEKEELQEILTPSTGNKDEFKSRLYYALKGVTLLVEDPRAPYLQHIHHVKVVSPVLMMKTLVDYNPPLWDKLVTSTTPITDIVHELSTWPKDEHLYGTDILD